MQDFEYYIKSNYHVQNTAAVLIKYTYSNRQAQDKRSKVPVLNHILTMTLTFYDNAGLQLAAEKLTFINDIIAPSSAKQLKTISPSEATNKFRMAKSHIIRQLINDRQQKINSLQNDLNNLMQYNSSNHDIIPAVMKGREVILSNSPSSPPPKHNFDM